MSDFRGMSCCQQSSFQAPVIYIHPRLSPHSWRPRSTHSRPSSFPFIQIFSNVFSNVFSNATHTMLASQNISSLYCCYSCFTSVGSLYHGKLGLDNQTAHSILTGQSSYQTKSVWTKSVQLINAPQDLNLTFVSRWLGRYFLVSIHYPRWLSLDASNSCEILDEILDLMTLLQLIEANDKSTSTILECIDGTKRVFEDSVGSL